MSLFQEPLNEQDRLHDEATVEKINLDRPIREIRSLHPTLRKCHCGFVGSKAMFQKHMDTLLAARRAGGESPEVFWSQHGEVPLNEDEA